jgi:peroxiredoxin
VAFGIFVLVHPRQAQTGTFAASITDKQEVAPLAPELSLTDLNGKTFKMSSLKGRVVVVNFWAVWCTPCTEEVPKFVGLQQKYQGRGLQVIGISIDDADRDLRSFYRRFGMNYPVIAGNQEVAEVYGGVLGLPTTFIIDRDGRIQKKVIGSTDFAALEQAVAAQLAKNGS